MSGQDHRVMLLYSMLYAIRRRPFPLPSTAGDACAMRIERGDVRERPLTLHAGEPVGKQIGKQLRSDTRLRNATGSHYQDHH